METSPEHKPFSPPPYIKPQLRPVSMSNINLKDSNELSYPWASRLSRVQAPPPQGSQSPTSEEPPTMPWKSKLRKVEMPIERTVESNEDAPALPPRLKQWPLSVGRNFAKDSGTGNSTSAVLSRETMSVASFPKQTMQLPSATTSPRVPPSHTPTGREEAPPSQGNSEWRSGYA